MGSGLGMNICKSIIKSLNHIFHITSNNEGTTVKVLINDLIITNKVNHSVFDSSSIKTVLYKDACLINYSNDFNSLIFEEINHSNNNILCENENEKKCSWKILIIDDHHSLRKSVVNVINTYFTLNNTNEEVYTLIEGNDGIDLLYYLKQENDNGTNNIKLVIIDENMNYISGSKSIELIRSLEKNNKFYNVFVCSLTAFSDEETINEIKSKGSNLVIEKPLNQTKFGTIMKELKHSSSSNDS